MRLIGYVRVSSVGGREGDSFISPVVQRERIEAEYGGRHTFVDWIEDLDQSGGKMDRPGFTRAMLMIENGEADGIAVAYLNRFARSVPGAADALRRIETAGGALLAADIGMDTSTSAGKLMRNVLMALAEFELDRVRESWAQAKEKAIERGVHQASRVPFGYERERGKALTPDPVKAPIVRELFHRRAAGESWASLAAWLDTVAPKPAGRVWTFRAVKIIIENRVYRGEARYGRQRPLVNLSAHQPLVERGEWEAAQLVPMATPRRNASLLAGVLRCGGCGFTMKRTANGGGDLLYRCRGRLPVGVCADQARISATTAETYTTEAFLSWLRESPVAYTVETLDAEAEAAAVALDATEEELRLYMTHVQLSVVGPDAFEAGRQSRQSAVDVARERLATLTAATSIEFKNPLTLLEEWPSLALTEQRELLADAMAAVYVRPRSSGSPVTERLHIVWNGEAVGPLAGADYMAIQPFTFPDEPKPRLRVAAS